MLSSRDSLPSSASCIIAAVVYTLLTDARQYILSSTGAACVEADIPDAEGSAETGTMRGSMQRAASPDNNCFFIYNSSDHSVMSSVTETFLIFPAPI